MTRIPRHTAPRLPWILAATAAVAGCGSAGQPALDGLVPPSTAVPTDTAALDRELQAARDAFSRAYVNAEFDAMAALYTEDGVLLPDDRIVRGRDGIRRYFTYGPGRTQVAHSMTATSLSVDGSTAVEIGVWSSTVRRGDDHPRTASGRHLLVWRRQPDGRWLIAYDAWHRPPRTRPEPQVVQDGLISSPDRQETFPAVDPADGSLWFSVAEGSFDDQRLFRAPLGADGWLAPEPVPFSTGAHGDRAPRFSADGATLYFTSNRPVPGHPEGDMNIWAASREGAGWGEPRPLPPPVNSPAPDIHVSATDSGDLFLATRREGGAGRSDLVRVPRRRDGFGPAERLPAQINDELSQPDVLAAPDGSWLIVAVTDHPVGLGGDDLFLTRRTAHGWTPLEHFPAPINSEAYEYGPTLSPDGRWLYFTSHRRGSADVYRIPLPALGLDPAR